MSSRFFFNHFSFYKKVIYEQNHKNNAEKNIASFLKLEGNEEEEKTSVCIRIK